MMIWSKLLLDMALFLRCKGKNYYFCRPMRKEKRTWVAIMSFLSVLFSLVFIEGCTTVSKSVRRNDGMAFKKDALQPVEVPQALGYDNVLLAWDYSRFESLNLFKYGLGYSHTVADSIIDYAMRFLRVPYVPSGKGPDKFDCSGFTSYVYRHFGYELECTAVGQLKDGWMEIKNPEELKRGDLVFYGGRNKTKRIGHVAIVVDNDLVNHRFTFIHATVNLGVTVSVSTELYYAKRYITACRILPES